jgi:hypothetical protein
MAFQVSPGVNVSEIDLTTIVPAVATSLAGISFPTEWGPGNEAVLVDTPKTFREIFGDVKDWNYGNYFTALNFLSYSRGLLMVRALGDKTKTANANTGGLTIGASGGEAYAPNDEYDISTFSGGFYAKYSGEKGNSLAVSIGRAGTSGVTGSWPYFSSFRRTPSSTDNLLSLGGVTATYDQVHIAVIDENGVFTGTKDTVLERFEGVSLHPRARRADGTSLYFKNVINNESKYIKCGGSLDAYDLTTAYDIGSGLGTAQSGTPTKIFGSSGLSAGGVTESNWENTFVFNWSNSVNTYVTASLAGGSGQEYTGSRTTVGDGVGYDVLADAEKIDVNLLLSGDITGPTEVQELKGIAETRKDCVVFFSCPVGREGKNVEKTDSEKAQICVDFKNTVGSSSYAIIDSGYRRQFDPFNQIYRWVPLNGDTAGLCARTEYDLDAWWSPAGYNRGILNGAGSLAFNPNRTYRDRIYPKGINPIINEKNSGTLLLGDKTALSKPSAFDRINVRRLFIVLEKAIATASKYSLFEFNDGFTRARFISLVSPYLNDVKSRRGLIDFKVVCDESNNTPERIDRNEFWADIYIKPNRSINYIQLNFIATRTGASFSEVGA